MTLAEQILAAHTDEKEVSPGEFINVRVDLILANDITAPIAIKEFQRIGVNKVFNPEKVVMVLSISAEKNISIAEVRMAEMVEKAVILFLRSTTI